MRRKFALDAILSTPWAIKPEWMKTITDIAQRHGEDPQALEARLGRPLGNAQRATVRNGVATIPITGPIFPRANMMTEMSGATSLDITSRDLTAALESPEVSAVILNIDSPGGVAFGINEMAGMIAGARGVKPVVAYVGGMGASAAYWLASAAGEIVVDPAAMLGSIGVVTAVPVQENPGMDGYRDIEVVSTNAPNKRPDPRTDEGLAEIRSELDALEAVFIETVAANRGVSPETVVADFGRGGVKVGIAAVNAGMADRIGSYEELQAELESQAARPGRTLSVNRGPGVSAEWIRNQLIPAMNAAAADGIEIRADMATRPGNIDAARATRHQTEETAMSLKDVTAEQLRADRPDLVAAIEKDAAAKYSADHETAMAAAAASAAAAERERILGIQAHCEPGVEALVAEMAADGKTTPDQAGARILVAQKERRAAGLANLKADDPGGDVKPSADHGGDKPAIAKDPLALSRAATKLIRSEAAAGNRISSDEAVARVLAGEAA